MAILATNDQNMARALSALETHVGTMRGIASTAERIMGELSSGYIADSSRAFQQKITEWTDAYNQVAAKFDSLEQNLRSSSSAINSGEDDASGMALSMDPLTPASPGIPATADMGGTPVSDQTYSVLST